MDFLGRYHPLMDITKIIALNLTAWMASHPDLDTLQKLSKSSHIGFGTIRRAKNGDGNITVQNLDAIARAFKRQAVDLLTLPDMNTTATEPATVYVTQEPPLDERELLQGYREASPDVRELMLDAAHRALKKQRRMPKKVG